MFHLLLAIIYLAFISLGLPDSLLGSAWPSMYHELSVPVSYSGIIFMIIACGTIISSLQSDQLTKKFGTGRVTAFSVLMTAAALLGFSVSDSYLELCLWAIPYGLGAGSVDASLNNYVALHYASRHMSWLHCMWGIGATLGPYIMGRMLSGGESWIRGYRLIALLQAALTAVLFFSIPLWNRGDRGKDSRQAVLDSEEAEANVRLSIAEILHIPGAKEIMTAFFCYSALEQTVSLWASSYLVLHHGLPAETAAGFAGLFFIGITAGRFASGFLTIRFNDSQMIRMGTVLILAGAAAFLLPLGTGTARLGLILTGLGCAPVYPSIIHSTPANFGAERSQAIIGVQMASAYIGTCLMPPLFGLIANHISPALFPPYLLAILALMAWMYERMLSQVQRSRCKATDCR